MSVSAHLTLNDDIRHQFVLLAGRKSRIGPDKPSPIQDAERRIVRARWQKLEELLGMTVSEDTAAAWACMPLKPENPGSKSLFDKELQQTGGMTEEKKLEQQPGS